MSQPRHISTILPAALAMLTNQETPTPPTKEAMEAVRAWASGAYLDEDRALSELARAFDAFAERQRQRAVTLLKECDALLEAPAPNCSCHISPPCADCVDFGGIRQMKKEIAAITSSA